MGMYDMIHHKTVCPKCGEDLIIDEQIKWTNNCILKCYQVGDEIDAEDRFNNEIENIANAILSLKLEKNEHQLEVEYLYSLFREFKVINNIKNRRKAEDLLENVITQYGLMLQEKVHGKGEPT